jgi:hypothetical protein
MVVIAVKGAAIAQRQIAIVRLALSEELLMLKELKFVQGAVAKKDLLPAMTHFRIEDGQVRSFNGRMAISSPLAFDINCNPKARQLVRAISKCKETITLSMTPGRKLRIQSGNFRAYVDTIDGDTPHPLPEGNVITFDGEQMLAACNILFDFVGNDASRPWTTGIMFQGQSAYATNNVCILEYWLGTPFPFPINVPKDCINELVRVNEPPTHAQIHERSITFHYTDGRWIRSQLLEPWTQDIAKLLNVPCTPKPVPAGMFEGIETLKSLEDGSSRIYMQKGMLRTSLEEFTGGIFEVEELDFEGCYNMTIFDLLKDVVITADFTLYPAPCLFFGDKVRGAIIGMRM